MIINRVEDSEDYDVMVNPQRTKIAFFSTRDLRQKTSEPGYYQTLYVMDVTGDNLSLVSNGFAVGNVNWSANGRYLAWLDQQDPSIYDKDLFLMNAQSGIKEKLNDWHPVSNYTFNHAGTALVFTQHRVEDETGDPYRITIYDLVAKESRRISGDQAWSMFFSEDDRYFYYRHPSVVDDKTVYRYARYDTYTFLIEDGVPPQPDPTNKVLSPDKSKLAYTAIRDGKSNVFIQGVQESEEEIQLTEINTVVGDPIWDKSGEYIIFTSIQSGESAKYIIGSGGGEAKKIVDIYSG